MFYIRFKIKYLLKNEWVTHFLFLGELCERFAHNRSFPMSNVSKSLRSLTKNEQCERIAQVTHFWWATMSDSLTSLGGNERSWVNRSGPSPKISQWVNRLICLSESLIHSFLGKKRAIRSENQWANSQPCQNGCSSQKLFFKWSLLING